MNSEEYLQKVTLGGVETLNAAIFLSPYDPAWPAAFEREADGIRAALGGAAQMCIRDSACTVRPHSES